MQSKLIRIGEAANLLGVSVDTLRRWDKKGIFPSVRVNSQGHRLYYFSEIERKLSTMRNQRSLAKKWAESTNGFELNAGVYCATRDVFQARLETLQSTFSRIYSSDEMIALAIAIAGEIGNNSFDHNLGNWPDMIGIFFYYDEKNRTIVLADRGQGILATLKRVKPELDNAREAMRTAFTEMISGRYPEARGNGLKFVRKIVADNPFSLEFQTGNAYLHLKQNDEHLSIQETRTVIRGCFSTIKIGGLL